MESKAVTNGNQRQPAIAVARAAGITNSQYARLRHAATTHRVEALGPTPMTRYNSVRQLIRQGLVTGASVEGVIANFLTFPVDADDPQAHVHLQLVEIVQDAALLLSRSAALSETQRYVVETVHALVGQLTIELDEGGE